MRNIILAGIFSFSFGSLAYASEQNLRVYPTQVNYDLPLHVAIMDGKYNEVSCYFDAEKEFPTTRKGVVDLDIVLISFDRAMSSEKEVIKELDKRGFRPVEFRELLAFGAKYRYDLQGPFIVALGSTWQDSDGDRGFPSVWSVDGEWSLYLFFDGEWSAHTRFAAVKK